LEQAERGSRIWMLRCVVEERMTRILEQKRGSRVAREKCEYEPRVLNLQNKLHQ